MRLESSYHNSKSYPPSIPSHGDKTLIKLRNNSIAASTGQFHPGTNIPQLSELHPPLPPVGRVQNPRNIPAAPAHLVSATGTIQPCFATDTPTATTFPIDTGLNPSAVATISMMATAPAAALAHGVMVESAAIATAPIGVCIWI